MTTIDHQDTRANDNRSLSSFLSSPERETARRELKATLLRLHDGGVDDAVLRDCLYDALLLLLQPPNDLTPANASSYYLQLRRFAGGLQSKCDEISALYEDE